jgi:hypothetical protein
MSLRKLGVFKGFIRKRRNSTPKKNKRIPRFPTLFYAFLYSFPSKLLMASSLLGNPSRRPHPLNNFCQTNHDKSENQSRG